MQKSHTCLMATAACLTILLAAPFAVQAAATADNSDELTDVINKVFLAYGGRDALAALDAGYTLVGKQENADGTTAQLRRLRKGQLLRLDIDKGEGAATITTVYDGRSAWKAIGNIVDEIKDDQLQLLQNERDHEPSVLVHFQDPGYNFNLLGRTTFHATPTYAIEVTHGTGSAETVFVDEKNYSVVALSYKSPASEPGAPVTVTNEYAQYRPAAATLFPFKQIQSVGNKQIAELAVTSIDATTPSDSEFRRPDKPDAVRLSKAEILPFEYSHKEVLVKVRINGGEPLDFLFDTAASQTVIDRATAAENLLDRGPNFSITTAAGAIPSQTTVIPKLELGNATLQNTQALILDLMPQTRQIGKRIAGIIGTNVISKFATTIDYAHNQIVLNDLDAFSPPANAIIVPFAQKRGPLVRALINGKDVPFLVDTGAAFNNLPTRVAKTLVADQTPHITEGTGLDGRPVKLAAVNVGSVKLGSTTVHSVTFTYSVDQDTMVQSKGVMQNGTVGVLGNPFWQRFAVTLDYKFDRLLLQPNATQSSRQEIEQLITAGDSKLIVSRDFRASENAYQKALLKVQAIGDPRLQAKIWGRIGNLRRVMAKDLSRPEQARIAYQYFSKAQEQAHKLQDRDTEGRILADWSLLYLDNGQVQAAQQALQGATLYAPQDPQVNVDFAVYLYKMQMYGDMQKYVEKALFLDPSNWQALWYKLKLSDMFSDVEQSKATLRDILKYYPWSNLARNKLTELTGPVPGTETPAPNAVPPSGAPTSAPVSPPIRP